MGYPEPSLPGKLIHDPMFDLVTVLKLLEQADEICLADRAASARGSAPLSWFIG